ncbi:MAG: hypothetical protein ACYTBJ_00365 [Planctomycetota bacterium]|jgi:hypothetical protein
MPKFRKKPIVVEAEQFWPNEKPWPEGVVEVWHCGQSFCTPTLGGRMQVLPGDWIITGIKGGRYLCKPDIFELTYEPVEE